MHGLQGPGLYNALAALLALAVAAQWLLPTARLVGWLWPRTRPVRCPLALLDGALAKTASAAMPARTDLIHERAQRRG
jgi:hypothetical protein